MELVELGSLSDEERAELEGDEVDPYGSIGNQLEWRPKDRHVALQALDGRLLAAAGWLIADIEVAGQHMSVVGIGSVIVASAHRGRGLGRRVIAEVLERAQEAGPELAMLFCQPDREDLYARRGFRLIDAPVRVQQPNGTIEVPTSVMWRRVHGEGSLPAGPVEVLGLPF